MFRDLPLAMHAQAFVAAEAAQCAHSQGKFWEYHDKLFENQRALMPENLKSYAASLGLDTDKFNSCLDNRDHKADVDEDNREAARLGVRGTPAFFVNGRFLNGAVPFEQLKAVIDEELANKGG